MNESCQIWMHHNNNNKYKIMHRECQWGGSALRSLLSLGKLVLVRVAMCCSVLRCGAVWCSVLQCGAVCCNLPWGSLPSLRKLALQCDAVRCSVVLRVAVWCSVVQRVTVCCSVPFKSLLSPRNLVVVGDMTHLFVTWIIHSCDMIQASIVQCVCVWVCMCVGAFVHALFLCLCLSPSKINVLFHILKVPFTYVCITAFWFDHTNSKMNIFFILLNFFFLVFTIPEFDLDSLHTSRRLTCLLYDSVINIGLFRYYIFAHNDSMVFTHNVWCVMRNV